MDYKYFTRRGYSRLFSIIVALIFTLISAGPVFFIHISVLAQEPELNRWLKQPVDDQTFQNYLEFFEYDQELAFEEKFLGSEVIDGIRVEHISFQSTPGERVYALYYSSAAEVTTDSPKIIYLHGGGALGKNGSNNKTLCEVMARAGYSVFAIDMKHYGERTTDLLQAFTIAERLEKLYNEPSTYLDWIIQTVKDVRRSFDFLVEVREVDPDRIALVGFSRGAQVSVIAGAVEQRFAGIALLYGGYILVGITQRSPAASTANYIGRISPRPLLMINGDRDILFLKDSSVLPLQELAGEPHLFCWFDASHGRLAIEEQTSLLDWLRECLRRDGRLPDVTPN